MIESFILGLLTPLTAVCVLPLYPGFLAFLSNKLSGHQDKRTMALFGVMVMAGVVSFMLLLGLLFTTILQASITSVISIISPIAFGILIIVAILLIIDVDFARFMPKVNAPRVKNPLVSAYLFGFFFGPIILPCNPGFIVAFLSRTALSTNFASSMSNFLLFGLGIGFPLALLSFIGSHWSSSIIDWLTKHKTVINRTVGVILLYLALGEFLFFFGVDLPFLLQGGLFNV